MIFDHSPPERRFFVPETVQTSSMDCGPATLKSMVEGFGISVSYGRLREACQTDIDGTSISTIEKVAVQLGLEAEQIMIPPDYLLMPVMEALPAIVVVCLPNGLPHFVVVWRLHGRFVQVMDPGTGRRWLTRARFLSEIYVHTHLIPASAWIGWAESDGFRDPLRHCLLDLGIGEPAAEQLIRAALDRPGWEPSATLDAATRMVGAMVRARALAPGREAGKMIEQFFDQARNKGPGQAREIIPTAYWSVEPPSPEQARHHEDAHLFLKGAVLIRVLGPYESDEEDDDAQDTETPEPLSPELAAALEESPANPEAEILHGLGEDGLLTPVVLVIALAFATFTLMIQALLIRGILDIGERLSLVGQRAAAVGMFFIFFLMRLFLNLPMTAAILDMGRRLEMRLRIAFLKKIPRIGDRYFHSRLMSDMAERAHDLRGLRMLPDLAVSFFRVIFQIILTTLAVIWLNPASSSIAVLGTAVFVGMSFITQPLLQEQDLRIRTLNGSMSRFYLDALLGLLPIQTHGAERAVRRQHEGLLVDWAHASMSFFRAELVVVGIEALMGAGFTVWILFNYVEGGGDPAGILLLIYWSLSLPALGRALANTAQQYPMHRNRMLRLLEPLSAPSETELSDEAESHEPRPESRTESEGGMAITFENIKVRAGGHIILSQIDLNIEPGEHIAIVGPSGAGKSSLAGLLLGWHRPASGNLRVDGRPLDGPQYHIARQQIAWVDPSVQLWNRSLIDNLCYGAEKTDASAIGDIVEKADLFNMLERLPHGLQTRMGESGGLVSGGEGQRVRLARAMVRANVRLAILDEPFRGLDREKRQYLLVRSREHWKHATLMFISHDVGESLAFDRVLVIEGGRIVEDDAPKYLANQPNSRYRALLASEHAVRKTLWESNVWRRLWLENGELREVRHSKITKPCPKK